MRLVHLLIEDIAFGGKGVGREQGKAVFVPYVIEGEKITVEVLREKKQLAEAELVEVNQPSPMRVAPRCPYFGRCGGCAYQHMSYAHQLAVKATQVGSVLRRIGKMENPPVNRAVASPNEYGYRNRITVHVDNGVIGFYRRDSHRLIDVEHCPIARAEVNANLGELRRSNPRDGNYTLRVDAPRIFTQTNDGVAALLRDALDQLIPSGQSLLVDAFCGAGFFAKALLPKFDRVIGIDWDRFAIAEARKGATEKETYLAGDVTEVLISRSGGLQSAVYDGRRTGDRGSLTVILDPPATGLTKPMREAIVDLAPAALIYVSCNPATLARDLKEMRDAFVVESITPFDMFPQTAEIEVLAHLTPHL